jgi:hypothetical protein
VALEHVPLPSQDAPVAKHFEEGPTMSWTKVGDAEIVSVADVVAVEGDALDELNGLEVIGRPGRRFSADDFFGGG